MTAKTWFFIEEPNVLRVCIKDENGNNNGEVFFFRYNILKSIQISLQ